VTGRRNDFVLSPEIPVFGWHAAWGLGFFFWLCLPVSRAVGGVKLSLAVGSFFFWLFPTFFVLGGHFWWLFLSLLRFFCSLFFTCLSSSFRRRHYGTGRQSLPFIQRSHLP